MWYVDTANNDENNFYVDNSKGFTVAINISFFVATISMFPLAVADKPLLSMEIPFGSDSVFAWSQERQYCYIKFNTITFAEVEWSCSFYRNAYVLMKIDKIFNK